MERVLTVASVFHAYRAFQSQLPAFILCLAFPVSINASVGVRAAGAAPPQVHFDLAPAVACHDVTPPEFAEANPDSSRLGRQKQHSRRHCMLKKKCGAGMSTPFFTPLS